MYLNKPFAEWNDTDKEKNLHQQYNAALEAKEKFNAYITLRSFDEILEEYESKTGPLKGLLIPIKDNISTKGIKTTCGSRILSNYIPIYNAHVIDLLDKSGAIVLGKTNMDEFAMGNTGETSFYGSTLNPWNPSHVPGGSSSGSAVSVAWKGMVALGSDTGGSIRQPAGYNGIIGLKPTYGFVSRYGLISYAESLEQIGPMARYARDLALILYYITEYDERDMTMFRSRRRDTVRKSLLNIVNNIFTPTIHISSASIAYSSKLIEKADENIQKIFYEALNFLEKLGAEIIDVETPFLESALSTYYIIAMVEASSNLARYDGTNYGFRVESSSYWNSVSLTRTKGFGKEVKRRIIMGGFASSKGYEGKYYIRALKARRWIKDGLSSILKIHSYFILPSSPILPPKFGEAVGPVGYIQDIYTVVPNLTGHPAISIPIGFIKGLPVGIQFIGDYFSDADLIYIASLFEGYLYKPDIIPGGGNIE